MTVTPDSWTVLETLRQSHRLLQVDVERLKTQCAATHGPATTASSSETTQQKQRHLVECAPCFSAFLDRLRQRYASSLGSTEWYAHRPSSFRAKLDALLQQQPTQPTNVAPSTASTGSSSSAIAAAAGRAQQLARLEDLLRREKLAWYGDALAGGASGSGNGLSLLSSSALSASGSGSHSPSSTAAVAAGPASAAAPATGPGTTAVRSDDAGLLGTLSGGLVRDVVTALTGEDPTEAHAAADQLLREARRGGNGSNGSGGEAEAAAFDDVVDAVRSGLASAVTVDDVAAAGTQPTVEMDYEALLRAAQADADAEIRRDDVDAKDGEKMDEEAKGGKVRDPRVIEATALLVRLARAGKQEAGSGLTSSPKAADEGNKESGTATHGSAAPQPSDAVEAMDVDEGGRVTEEKASGAADSPLPEGLDRYLRMLSVSAMSPLGTTSSTTTVAQLLDPVIRQMLADHAEQQRLDRRIAEKKAELERQRRALGVYERRQQGRKRGRGGGVGDEDAKMAGDDGGGKRLGAIAGHGHSSAAAGQPGTAADAMSTGKMRCGNCGEAVDESRYWTCALCRVLIDYGFYDETSGVFCSKTCYDEGFERHSRGEHYCTSGAKCIRSIIAQGTMIREDREAEELHVAGVKTEAPSAADEEKPGRRDPWRPRDGETAESLLEGADAAVGMITADADENMVLLADGSEMLLDRYQVAAAASNGDSQPASPAPMLFGKAEAQAWICNDCIDLATAFKEHQTAKKAAADDVMDHDHEPVRPTASPVFCHVNCARVNFKRHQESVHGYRAPGRDEAERQGPGCPIVYTGASDMYEPRDPLHHVTFLGDALARMAERATERGVEGEATVAVDAPDAAAAEEVKEPKREPA